MADFFDLYKCLFEENLSFKVINQSSASFAKSEPLNLGDFTSTPVSDFAGVPMDSSEFSIVDAWNEILLRDFYPNDQSTQILRISTRQLVDVKDIREHEKRFAGKLLQLIREEIFEFGTENAADRFLQENLRDNPVFTKEWLNSIFLKHFGDIEVIVGLLRIVMHLKYEEIYPTGPTMALSVLNHENAELRECGIRAFENWGNPDSLEYLTHIKCEEQWLQDYLEQVISYLGECRAFFSQKS